MCNFTISNKTFTLLHHVTMVINMLITQLRFIAFHSTITDSCESSGINKRQTATIKDKLKAWI